MAMSMAVKLGVGWMLNLGPALDKSEHPPHEMGISFFQFNQIGSDFQRFSVDRIPDANSSKFIQLVPIDEVFPFVIIRLYKRDFGLVVKYTFESVWVESHGYRSQDTWTERIDFLSAEMKYSYRSIDAFGLDQQARLSTIKWDL